MSPRPLRLAGGTTTLALMFTVYIAAAIVVAIAALVLRISESSWLWRPLVAAVLVLLYAAADAIERVFTRTEDGSHGGGA